MPQMQERIRFQIEIEQGKIVNRRMHEQGQRLPRRPRCPAVRCAAVPSAIIQHVHLRFYQPCWTKGFDFVKFFLLWRRTQAVRGRSAKPLCTGSNPVGALPIFAVEILIHRGYGHGVYELSLTYFFFQVIEGQLDKLEQFQLVERLGLGTD